VAYYFLGHSVCLLHGKSVFFKKRASGGGAAAPPPLNPPLLQALRTRSAQVHVQ